MRSSHRVTRARLGVLALTAALVLAVGVVPALAHPADGTANGLRDWLSRAMRALAPRARAPLTVPGDTAVVYGPLRVTSPSGSSTLGVERFTATVRADRQYLLEVERGDGSGAGLPTTLAVTLNGSPIVSASDFASGVVRLTRVVALTAIDTVTLAVSGSAGATAQVRVLEIADPTVLVYGPAVFLRETGQPQTETVRFTFDGRGGAPYRMCILNGLPDGTKRTSSATVVLNGQTIVTQSDVNQQVGGLTRTVPLVVGENVMEVRVTSVPSSRITLCVTATDVTAPVLTIAAPPVGQITREATIAVSGTVSDQTATRVTVNGGETVRSGDAWSATASLAVEGTNTLTVHAVDAAGNATDSLRTVIRDSEAPVIALESPAAEQTLTRADSADVVGRVTDRTTVTLTVNGAPVAVGTDGRFATRTALASGANFVIVSATDQAGNASSVTRQVTRDNVPPVIAWTTPANGAIVKTTSIDVVGTIVDQSAVTLTLNGAAVALSPATGGSTPAAFQTTALLAADGPVPLTLIATDAAGNVATLSRTITRDATPPTIIVQQPAAGLVTNTGTAHVTGTVTDLTVTTLTVSGTAIPLGADGSFAGDIPLVAGSNTLAFVATDAAGNVASVDRVVVQDREPPVVTLLAPAPDSLTAGATMRIRGRAYDASAFTLTVNGAAVAVAADSTFETEVALGAEGALSYPIVAVDAAGNQAQISATIVRDVTPPVVAVLAPAAGSVTREVTTAVSGTVADAHTVRVTVNGIAMQVANGTFSGVVPLDVDGVALLVATATDAAGNSTSASTTTTRDTQAPLITVESPASGTTTPNASVIVRGHLTDATPTTLTIASAAVPLGGGNTFETTVALVRGVNTIALSATDQAGNVGTASLSITRRTLEPGVPPDPSTVAPPLNRTVASIPSKVLEFLYTGSDPIQTGVAAGTIDKLRAASVRGRVFQRDPETGELQPLQGATVAVLGHAELGQTKSREDGGYDLVVNGGSRLTVTFAKSGYFPAQRAVDVAWLGYSVLDDVVLLTPDPVVTTIALGAANAQVARASVETDADGPRQATLIVPAGTQATVTLPNGTTQALTSLGVRATEYTVGDGGAQAMPAGLPPTTQYTYAVQLSADEALAAGASLQDVVLSRPVPLYLENFLKVPVGTAVPSGAYDARLGQWVAQENGRVIRVLSVDGGVAQIDANGDGAPDTDAQLAALGMDAAERAKVAETYQAGITLWRAPVTRFWPYDLNFGGTISGVAPIEQIKAGPLGALRAPGCATKNADPIACDIQVATQSVGITGAPFTLEYTSSRSKAAIERTLSITLTGATLPADLQEVLLDVQIAGQRFTKRFAPVQNLVYDFVWDGKDGFGRPVQGYQQAYVNIGHSYPFTYRVPASQAKAFGLPCDQIPGQPGACSLPYSATTRARVYAPRWSLLQATLGGWDATPQGFGGFSPSVHHVYDPIGRVLQLGNGSRRTAERLGAVVRTVAGTGVRVFGGDGGPARKAQLITPQGVAVGADGSIYAGDYSAYRIRRIAPDGTISTFAGNGNYRTNVAEGVRAVDAGLGFMSEVVAMPDGSVLFTFQGEAIVWRVDPNGILRRFAGGGSMGFTDGVPARDAGFIALGGIAAGPDGSVYIADANALRIRRVTPDGIITTIAGTGGSGFGTDEIPALRTVFASPRQLAVGPDGTVYVVDMHFNAGNAIRKITPDGVIHLVLRGIRSFGGSMAVARDGTLYVADDFGLFKITTDGKRVAVSGNDGTIGRGFQFPESPVIRTQMASISGVAVANNGDILVTIADAGRVQRVSAAMPGLALGAFVIPSSDGGERYVLDESGRHVETRDAVSNRVNLRFGYDSVGRLASVTDKDDRTTLIAPAGSGILIQAPDGWQSGIAMNAQGRAGSVSGPHDTTTFSYNAEGLLATVTHNAVAETTYGYDEAGRVNRITTPDNGTHTLSTTTTLSGSTLEVLSAEGRSYRLEHEFIATGEERLRSIAPGGLTATTTLAPDGAVTSRSPDGTLTTHTARPHPTFGMLSEMTDTRVQTPGNRVLTMRTGNTTRLLDPFDPTGPVESVTDSVIVNGQVLTTLMNNESQSGTLVSGAGHRTFFEFDENGRVVRDSVPGLAAVHTVYDPAGRVAAVVQGPRVWGYRYDERGALKEMVDALGRVRAVTRAPNGRLAALRLPGRDSVTLGHDRVGRLSRIQAGARSYTDILYTAGDLESERRLVIGDTSRVSINGFDREGRLTRSVGAGGDSARVSYDPMGRVANVATTSGTTTFAYDSLTGQMRSATTSNGITLRFTYDGPLLTSTEWQGAVVGRVGFGYDNSFRVTSLQVNGAELASFAYAADGALTRAGALVLRRDAANGLFTGGTLGSLSDTVGRNPFGEVVWRAFNRGATALFSESFDRDSIGRVLSVHEVAQGITRDLSFSLDSAGWLRGVAVDGVVTESHEYDRNGNRVRSVTPAGVVSYTVDAADRLLSAGGVTFGYTPSGSRAFKASAGDTTRYVYSTQGDLTRVTTPTAQVEYLFDASRRRVATRVDGKLRQRLLYGGDLAPVAELDSANQVVSRFVYGGRVNVPEYMVRGDVTYRIITDRIGSVRLVVDAATGVVAQRLDYDAFGQVQQDSRPGFQPFGFAGGLYDRLTRLTRFGAREYDAEVGRWLQRDPLEFGGGDPNLYVYASNDPINQVDPSGEQTLFDLQLKGGIDNVLEDALWSAFLGSPPSAADFAQSFLEGLAGGDAAKKGKGLRKARELQDNARKAANKMRGRYTVYLARHADGSVEYVGKSAQNRVGRRATEHLADHRDIEVIDMFTGDGSLSSDEAEAVEQAMMFMFGGSRGEGLPQLGNKRLNTAMANGGQDVVERGLRIIAERLGRVK